MLCQQHPLVTTWTQKPPGLPPQPCSWTSAPPWPCLSPPCPHRPATRPSCLRTPWLSHIHVHHTHQHHLHPSPILHLLPHRFHTWQPHPHMFRICNDSVPLGILLCPIIVPKPSILRYLPSVISALCNCPSALYWTKSLFLGVIWSVRPLSKNHSTVSLVSYQENLIDSLLVIDNSLISTMSNTLALICAFSFPFPFLSVFFFPDDPDAFGDFCPLPFCRRFPPGQWFCIVWFVLPHFVHFWPMFFMVENLLRDKPCPSAWPFLLDSSWSTHAMMSVNL